MFNFHYRGSRVKTKREFHTALRPGMRRGKWRARKLRNTGCCMERKCGDPKVDFRKQLDRVRQKGLLVWITYKDGSKGKFSWNTDKKKSSAYRQPLAMSDRGRKGFHIFSRATKNLAYAVSRKRRPRCAGGFSHVHVNSGEWKAQ